MMEGPTERDHLAGAVPPPVDEVAAVPTAASPRGRGENVVRSAGIASAAIGLSRITGLLREMAMSRLFGAGLANDAFLLAFRLPNLTRDLFAEGALSSAFVPTFTEYLTQRSRAAAARLANLVATAVVLIVGALCLLGMVFAPLLVRLIAPGYEAIPAKFDLAVRMTRIMFPFLLFVALAAQAMGVLNACGQFGVPALASMFFNISSLSSGLLIGFVLGPHFNFHPIEGIAFGVLIGGLVQLLWQVPSLRRHGFSFRPQWDWADPGLRRIFAMMGPAILGNAAVQVNVVVNTIFASQVNDPVRGADGPVSWLGYAFRFMQLPIGLFGVAIASATLPAVSRSAASGDMDAFRATLARSLGITFLLTIPSSVGLAVLGEAMIAAVYQGGRFDAYDTAQTGVALSCYALGLAGYSGLKVLTPAFYVLKDSRTPMVVGLLSVVVNYVTAASLVGLAGFGHAGLALSTSAVATTGFVVLFLVLRSRIGGVHGRALLSSFSRTVCAAAVMGGAVAALSTLLRREMGATVPGRLLELGVGIPLGVAVFYAACRFLRVGELEEAISAVAGPLRRRIPFLRARLR